MAELSFFEKLSQFCGNVEENISQVQDSLKFQAGTRPQNYGKALDSLKSDMEELQKLSSDIKSELPKLLNVNDFRCSLREMINEYKENIWRAEDFMKIYGYKPPTENALLFHEEKEIVEEPQPEENYENVQSKIEVALLSPELSKFGKDIMRGKDTTRGYTYSRRTPELQVKPKEKDIPLIFSAIKRSPYSLHKVKLEEHLRAVPPTPIPLYDEDILTPFITKKSIRPKLNQQIPFDVNSNSEQTSMAFRNYSSQKELTTIEIITDEQELVRYKVEHGITNVSPIKNIAKVQSLSTRMREDDHLVCRNNVLSYSKSPVMSDIIMGLLNEDKEGTPESPVLSDVTMRLLCKNKTVNLTPDSPLMSDTTVKFINADKL